MENPDKKAIEFFTTDELVEEVLGRVDSGVVILHTILNKDQGQYSVRTKGPRVYVIGLLHDTATKLKMVLDDFVEEDDETS